MTRLCSACLHHHDKSAFSRTQLNGPQCRRRCKSCIEKGNACSNITDMVLKLNSCPYELQLLIGEYAGYSSPITSFMLALAAAAEASAKVHKSDVKTIIQSPEFAQVINLYSKAFVKDKVMYERVEELTREVRRLKTKLQDSEERNLALTEQIEDGVSRAANEMRELLIKHQAELEKQKDRRKKKEKKRRKELRQQLSNEARGWREQLSAEAEYSETLKEDLLQVRACIFGLSHRDYSAQRAKDHHEVMRMMLEPTPFYSLDPTHSELGSQHHESMVAALVRRAQPTPFESLHTFESRYFQLWRESSWQIPRIHGTMTLEQNRHTAPNTDASALISSYAWSRLVADARPSSTQFRASQLISRMVTSRILSETSHRRNRWAIDDRTRVSGRERLGPVPLIFFILGDADGLNHHNIYGRDIYGSLPARPVPHCRYTGDVRF